jgi:hypothetical protein
MKKITSAIVFSACALLMHSSTNAQLLKKLKDKANQVANRAIDKKVDEKVEEKVGVDVSESGSDGNSTSSSSSSSGRPTNKGGEGLKNTTPPDVNQQIIDAEKAHSEGNYNEARYSIQQALMGVEIQIGQEILKSLPVAVDNVPKDSAQDRVMSTKWGWANMTIQRVYRKDDKQLTVTIGNNPLYAGTMDLYFSGAYGAQSNGETQDMKQIKVKGNKAVIKYDKNEGYSVLVQLGQSGMITFQGINYANEAEITNAINTFDIDSIKNMLGEK